jgi:hypothetical protein
MGAAVGAIGEPATDEAWTLRHLHPPDQLNRLGVVLGTIGRHRQRHHGVYLHAAR